MNEDMEVTCVRCGGDCIDECAEFFPRAAARQEVRTEGRERRVFMVHANWAGAVFVKEYDFFMSQGGGSEDWGQNWRPVVATSIEEACQKGCELFPHAKPYSWQAKP